MSEFTGFAIPFLRQLEWSDVLDIILVSILLYRLMQLIRGGRAFQMAVGTVVLIALYFTSRWAQLETVNWLLRNSLAYIGFAVIVLYQAELRRALANLGRAPLFRLFPIFKPAAPKGTVDEIVFATMALARRRIGALIVLERGIGLRSYIEGGVQLDAVLTYDLMLSIFNPKAPLHDGAVIIQGNRVAAAACFLPITINPQLSRELGTRHRAAIGITEETDAVAIVVSEETAMVSWIEDGRMIADLEGGALRRQLNVAFGHAKPKSEAKIDAVTRERTT